MRSKELAVAVEQQVLKFLTINPKSHIISISKYVSELLESDIVGGEKVQQEFRWASIADRKVLARTVTNKLLKDKRIKATSLRQDVLDIVVKPIKSSRFGPTSTDHEIKCTTWFVYEIDGKEVGSLIGTHLYGI